MLKKFLLLVVLILISLTAWKQDSTAKTWERYNTTVHADSILAAIERGDSVIVDSCEIFGPLTKIGAWEKPDTIESSIRITHTTFRDKVDFLGCHFSKDVWFDSSIFFQHVSFFHTTFGGVADFSGATFSKLTLFTSSVFEGSAHFDQTHFTDGAAFDGAIFGGYVSFGAATIRKGALFLKATFDKTVMFNYAEVEWGNFVYASFNGDAFFRNASFEEANFRKAQFAGIVDFSLRDFKDVVISWNQLKGHLWFFKPAVYKLMKYFEEQRQLDDADGVYLFLKDQERIRKPWYVRYPEYWFIQLMCGYGTKPLRALATSGLVMILFAIFYYLIKIREPKRALGAGFKRIGMKAYNALYFSINTFVVGAPIEWAPDDTQSSTKHYLFRILATVERTLGWILLVLFVVTLTRKFIR